jgi:hypothetical protein
MSGAFIPPSQGGGGVEVDDRADVIAPQAAGIVVAPVAGQRRVGPRWLQASGLLPWTGIARREPAAGRRCCCTGCISAPPMRL